MADLCRLESRGFYFYHCPTPSYNNSCPHISCLSVVRNSWPISALPLSSARLFHSPLCVSGQLLRSLRFWSVFDLIGDLWGLFGYKLWIQALELLHWQVEQFVITFYAEWDLQWKIYDLLPQDSTASGTIFREQLAEGAAWVVSQLKVEFYNISFCAIMTVSFFLL